MLLGGLTSAGSEGGHGSNPRGMDHRADLRPGLAISHGLARDRIGRYRPGGSQSGTQALLRREGIEALTRRPAERVGARGRRRERIVLGGRGPRGRGGTGAGGGERGPGAVPSLLPIPQPPRPY